MAFQTVFKRHELKFLITKSQKEKILSHLLEYMQPDEYGKTTIRNLYYDTDDYLLIRRSIDKPVYKEKIRLRSYQSAAGEDKVFVELKKKYNSLVFKRRMILSCDTAKKWLSGQTERPNDSQIAREIDYFLRFYKSVHPTVFLSYEREAYYSRENRSFRVTFDSNILCRTDDLSLGSDIYGTPVLPDEMCMMEIKCSGAIEKWLVSVLSEEKIFKTSFSKYGRAYQQLIFPKTHSVNIYNMLEV